MEVFVISYDHSPNMAICWSRDFNYDYERLRISSKLGNRKEIDVSALYPIYSQLGIAMSRWWNRVDGSLARI